MTGEGPDRDPAHPDDRSRRTDRATPGDVERPDDRSGARPTNDTVERDRPPIDPDFSRIAEPTEPGSEPTAPESTAPESESTDDEDDAAHLPEPGSTPVVAGRIDREHAAFVILGALTTVVILVRTTGIAF